MIKEVLFQPQFLKTALRALGWHFNYYTGRPTAPVSCGFYITTRCNFHCEFCNIWRINPPVETPEPLARQVIGGLGKMGLIYFSFSGGEPLLAPRLFELLDHARKSGIAYTHVVSNGYLMDREKALMLKKSRLSEISFSLDGQEAFHDGRRGIKGSFKKVMEAVEHVRATAPGTRVVLNAILDPLQPHQALFAVKKAGELKVKIKVQPLNNHPSFGNAGARAPEAVSPDEDAKKRLLDVIAQLRDSASVINTRAFLENYRAFLFSRENLLFGGDKCLFGRHHLEIFANQAFPCLEAFCWQAGAQLSSAPIKEILNSDVYRKNVEQLEGCAGCKKSYYVCYYEPRMNFPAANFLKTRLWRAAR